MSAKKAPMVCSIKGTSVAPRAWLSTSGAEFVAAALLVTGVVSSALSFGPAPQEDAGGRSVSIEA